MVQYAYDIGLKGITLTDHEGIIGHIKAWKYFLNMQNDNDFKLALGNEIYLMSEQAYQDNVEIKGQNPYYHFILTALDDIGHKQIRMLSDRAWQRAKSVKGLMRRPTYYTDLEDIIVEQGHLIASSACLGSELDNLILLWKQGDDKYKQNIHNFITWCIEIFGKNNFYLEIQPCH